MLSLEVRKKSGEAEVRRVTGPLITIGASTGNQVVVRARGVAGRHARILEKDGGYFLDVFRGVEPVFLNGRETQGGPLGIGDRITIGEASITLLNGRPSGRVTPPAGLEVPAAAPSETPAPRPATNTPPSPTAALYSDADYRGFRLDVFRRLKRESELADAATEVVRYLTEEVGPEEWAAGFLEPSGAFEILASTFQSPLELPASVLEDLKRAMGGVRADLNGQPIALFSSPGRAGERRLVLAVRESSRLAPRAAAFVEEVAQMCDLAWSMSVPTAAATMPAAAPSRAPIPENIEIVVASDSMRRLVLDLPRIARSRAPVLIWGEVGTGKDLVAAAIHRQGDSASGPFVVVDCASMSRLEEEIFGRSTAGPRGSRRPGRLDESAGGTLVLNEVGYLPQTIQARIFDVLASAGETGAAGIVRWIATTSTNLLPAVENGTFRRDLYFRLAVLTIRLPSLAERREDIPALFEHFARKHASEGLGPMDPDALNALLTYRYPGNARELENEVVRLAAVSQPGEPVALDRLDSKFRESEAGIVLHEVDDLKKIIDSVERQVIDRVMRKVEGNQSRGAELLNISRGSLIAKMSEYGVRDYRYLRRERKRNGSE
jgi:DNA-binding NtrC family response regulator/pSer/pThr/pTyr-binding forkhead associated (FHA) protein